MIHTIERLSGTNKSCIAAIKTLKSSCVYYDYSKSVGGDAPKMFVGIYEYRKGCCHKRNKEHWPRYIAKTGHKWYPMESVTEFLFNRLGCIFGLEMAESGIALIEGQVRFLSKYFLRDNKEELVHGADMIAAYLNESDTRFVDEVDKNKMSRELFHIQFLEEMLTVIFPNHKEYIMHELVRLVVFDALVGNNDRHFYNWGIIRGIYNKRPSLRFSPIYDTARGLFWNYDETHISKATQRIDAEIKRYCDNSTPKIGWNGEKKLNHFKLVQNIYDECFYISKEELRNLVSLDVLEKMKSEIDSGFCRLMSENRRNMIKRCLEYRFNTLNSFMK